MTMKFRQLIQKQDAIVRQAYFAGSGHRPAADQSRIGNRMMRGSERPRGYQSGLIAKQAGDGMDFCCLNRFLESHWRQNRGKPSSEHRLSGSGRSNQDNVVAAGDGDFHGALRLILPFDVSEIDIVGTSLRQRLLPVHSKRNPGLLPIEKLNNLQEIFDGKGPYAIHHSRFARICFGNNQMIKPFFTRH